MTRPTLDLREGLTRITQRETRQVMVFERMKEESRSSREVMVLGTFTEKSGKPSAASFFASGAVG